MKQTIINNANVILSDDVILGHLIVDGDRIVEVKEGLTTHTSTDYEVIDVQGDYVLPGLIELHTDNMEKFFEPRPGVDWPGLAAAIGHDTQMSAAGITTVFDAVSVGYDFVSSRKKTLPLIVEAITKAEQQGLHKSEHFLHLRCEVSSEDTYQEFMEYADNPLIRLASLMDHAPGQRQFANIDKYRQYYQGKYGYNDAEMNDFIDRHQKRSEQNSQRNRDDIAAYCHQNDIALASHDDAKIEHVKESIAYQVTIAEFPTTVDAAKSSHENDLKVLMGAPNLIRGMSHSGNISAATLAEHGYLDIISSDYYPSSLLHSAFKLAQLNIGYDLPQAIRCVTQNPASSVGFDDRGSIKENQLADLLQVKIIDDLPIIKRVWKKGVRVH